MSHSDQRQKCRHHAHGDDKHYAHGDGPDGKCQQYQIEFQESALLHLAIDNVHGLEEGLDTVVGAPHRHQQPEDETEAESGGLLVCEAVELALDEIEAALWQ